MKFQMLIKFKMLKNNEFSYFQMLRCCIYHAHKYLNANNCNCWHFNIVEHDKFHAQLSCAQKKFYNLGSKQNSNYKTMLFVCVDTLHHIQQFSVMSG